MISRHCLLLTLFCLSVFTNLTSGYTWPSPQYDTLEALLYEGRRSDGSSLASIVHPCRKRTNTLSSIAAEWLRFAFHDMSTHNVDNGTGGLDGSLAYELDREENFGSGFAQTLDDFSTQPNKYVSRADVIAVAAVLSVSTCGGPTVPFRGGRVDVYEGGSRGVPEPQQDLPTLTELFRRQGFTQTEMIKLVACGHSIGGVRNTDFPQLVPASNNSNFPNIITFDTTDAYDDAVVTQYLNGTTQNVLVVSSTPAMNSDLRVFSCDGNATMQSIATPQAYASECQEMIGRMIDTVAHGITLTDEITLLPAKVHDVQLTIEKSQLVFKSSLRLTQAINGTINKARTVTMLWCDNYGSEANCNGHTKTALPATTINEDPNLSPVTQNMGLSFINYNFVVPINVSQSVSKFWFSVDEHDGSHATVYNNGGDFYMLPQDQVIFVPTMSSMVAVQNNSNSAAPTFTKSFTLVAGVRGESVPSRVYLDAHDFATLNFTIPFNTTVDLSLNHSQTSEIGYVYYSAVVQDTGFQMTFDLHTVINGTIYTSDFLGTTFLDNTPYVAPTNVSIVASSSSSTSGAETWRPSKHSIWFSLSLGLGILLGSLL